MPRARETGGAGYPAEMQIVMPMFASSRRWDTTGRASQGRRL